MGHRPRALILCPEPPYPAIGGGALRTASLVEFLAGRYELDVIAFRLPGGPDPAKGRLAELTSRRLVVNLPVHQRHTTARGLRNLGRLWRGVPPLTDRFSGFEAQIESFVAGYQYRLALIEHFWCAGYVSLVAEAAEETVLDLHNIESVLHRGCAESERWPISLLHSRFHQACGNLERRLLPKFSTLLAVSDDDAGRLRALAPGVQVVVYPNSIPLTPLPARSESPAVAFTGNLEYHPNMTAVRHFRDAIWPSLRSRWPELEWWLIGRNPNGVRRTVEGLERVRLVGPVDDAVSELARARVAVVPLLAGSGTRVKILEAWAAGTPVVSTSIGAEGLGATPGEHLLVADEPGAFAEAVSRLLSSPDLRQRISAAGRALYEREYTWEAGWRKLSEIVL